MKILLIILIIKYIVILKFLYLSLFHLKLFIEKEMLAKNIWEIELKEFNKRIKFNEQIIDYLLSPKIIFNNKFKLIAVINTPTYNHYNSLIIDLSEKFKIWN